MGWRRESWGGTDLEDVSEYSITGLIRGSTQFLDLGGAWRKLRHLIGRNPQDIDEAERRIEDVLSSTTYLPQDGEWTPVRPIGRGGFGVAALFERKDINGETTDVSNSY